MRRASCEVELPYGWEVVGDLIVKPGKILPFFPYFEKLQGDRVKFKVSRFMAKIGYEFTLSVALQEKKALYTFTGERGILTVGFEMEGKKLKVTASWAGFAEILMGKPLKNFVEGIAKAISEFCSAGKCPLDNGFLDVDAACSLFKKAAITAGNNFTVECNGEDGSVIRGEVRAGRLKKIYFKDHSGKTGVVEADVSILDVDKELFNGFPLGKKYSISIKSLGES